MAVVAEPDEDVFLDSGDNITHLCNNAAV